MSNEYVVIPREIAPVSAAESARLLEKIWRARIAMKRSPTAAELNFKLRESFGRRLNQKVIPLRKEARMTK